jgi:hypothetical protein
MSRLLAIVAFALPIVVVAAVWAPLVEHYYVPRARISEASIEAFTARPSDDVMSRLGEQFLGVGVIKDTGLPADSPEERLRQAGLFRVPMELDELERRPDAQQFAALARSVLEFSKRANGRLAYDEFLWNDHAIANRMFVLAKFWGRYRRDASFAPADAAEILEHVAKNAEFLMRDDHFTYWTNHGVMQSIALLHAANAFPALPQRERMIGIALERLDEQLRFFVSDSGWIMEHSAEYQEFGANLLATLLVELELLGREAPPEWHAKSREAKRVLDWLVRPGGSIPNFGDSDAAIREPTIPPAGCDAISPGVRYWPEGYFVAWDVGTALGSASCAQTAVVWSDFVNNAHKRPHALSVHYWADGVDYAMGAGYWPYGDPERPEATGWRASNAPHYAGETGDAYTVTARGYCTADDFRFVDLERDNDARDGSVRRQIVDLGVAGILLVDSSEGRAAPRETVWRVDARTTFIGPDGSVLQAGSASGDWAHVVQVAGASAAVETLADVYARAGHPSPEKFSIVAARGAVPTYVATSASTEPSLTALGMRAAGSGVTYRFGLFESPERWRIEDQAGRLVVERDGRTVSRAHDSASSSECEAVPAATADDALARMAASYTQLERAYPIFKPWGYFRLKATLAVLALLVAQLLLFALLARFAGRALRSYAMLASVVGWLGLGAYLTLIYLAQ